MGDEQQHSDGPPASANGSGMRDRITLSPPPFDRLSFEMAVRQRDEAHARVEELEAIARDGAEMLAEVQRLRDLLRVVSEILGVQEFESLIEVAQSRMDMLASLQKKHIADGMRDAARQAGLTNMHEELNKLREEIQRLKARP